MKRAKLLTTSSSTTTISSRPGHLVCPACESGELQPQQAHGLAASCAVCDCLFSGVVLNVLAQIAALPEAQGKHACEECHHPEMRLLPEGVFHCPACGSEVLPIETGARSLRASLLEVAGLPNRMIRIGEAPKGKDIRCASIVEALTYTIVS